MRSFLMLTVAAAIAFGELATASLVWPAFEGPAMAAAKAKKPRGRAEARSTSQTTGFEHQQCSVQQPCSTRNTW